MRFDESFFKGEERDGFYVEEEMKRAWAAQMEVLMEIDRICRKYDIRYFADAGTLLGAVRHNGFIPWDDDLDVAMFRKDYMKFINVAQWEIERPAACLDIYHFEERTQPFAMVINTRRGFDLSEEHLRKYHGCPYSIGVDIFILDNMPPTEAEYDVAIGIFEWAWTIKEAFEKGKIQLAQIENVVERQEAERIRYAQTEESLSRFEAEAKVTIDRQKNIPNQLLRIVDGISAMYSEEESDEVANLLFGKQGLYHAVGRKKEWYRDTIMLPFENITIPAPVEFYKVLEKTYGPNYLTPVKKWHYHDYPYYKENKKELQKLQKDVKGIQGKMDRLEKLLGEA